MDILAEAALAGCTEDDEGVAEDTSAVVQVAPAPDIAADIEAVSCWTPEALRSLVVP